MLVWPGRWGRVVGGGKGLAEAFGCACRGARGVRRRGEGGIEPKGGGGEGHHLCSQQVVEDLPIARLLLVGRARRLNGRGAGLSNLGQQLIVGVGRAQRRDQLLVAGGGDVLVQGHVQLQASEALAATVGDRPVRPDASLGQERAWPWPEVEIARIAQTAHVPRGIPARPRDSDAAVDLGGRRVMRRPAADRSLQTYVAYNSII